MNELKLPTPPEGYTWEVEPFGEFFCSITLGPEDEALIFEDETSFYEVRYFRTQRGLEKAAARLLKAFAKHEVRVRKIRDWKNQL